MMASVGTPIVAVERGSRGRGLEPVRRLAHRHPLAGPQALLLLRAPAQDHPYAPDLKEGQVVKAGDLIGYLGMTGYSTKENVNNINTPHLHFGMQLVFDESQKEALAGNLDRRVRYHPGAWLPRAARSTGPRAARISVRAPTISTSRRSAPYLPSPTPGRVSCQQS